MKIGSTSISLINVSVTVSLQADFEGSASLLSRLAEEGSPQDIENFEIFKGNAGLVCIVQVSVGLKLC